MVIINFGFLTPTVLIIFEGCWILVFKNIFFEGFYLSKIASKSKKSLYFFSFSNSGSLKNLWMNRGDLNFLGLPLGGHFFRTQVCRVSGAPAPVGVWGQHSQAIFSCCFETSWGFSCVIKVPHKSQCNVTLITKKMLKKSH